MLTRFIIDIPGIALIAYVTEKLLWWMFMGSRSDPMPINIIRSFPFLNSIAAVGKATKPGIKVTAPTMAAKMMPNTPDS